MIIYKNILERLKDAGWSTYRLRKEKKLSEGIIQSLRDNKSISVESIDMICYLLDCQPGDFMEYIPNEPSK